jgi:uncharacterized membrane protein YhfC
MDLLTITHFLNGFLMIFLPILLGIYLTQKFHLGWKMWFIGGAIFIISQIFHIPFNTYILNPLLGDLQQAILGTPGQLIVAVLLGLSAGVFEECARYVMYRWWIKDARSWRKGILAGAGHGGAEAIILGVLVMLTYINMLAYRNLDLSSLNLSPDKLEVARQQIQAYWSYPWYVTLLGAVERAFTIPFHIAASVLVLQVFTRRPGHQQIWWLGLAILYHTLMDASAVFISSQWGGYVVEVVLAVTAVLDIIIIFALRQPEPEPSETASLPTSVEPLVFTPTPIEETSENLENTRYQ